MGTPLAELRDVADMLADPRLGLWVDGRTIIARLGLGSEIVLRW